MKTDVVLLPGLHGSTALFEGFVALAPPWARCRPIALPTSCDQTFDKLTDAIWSADRDDLLTYLQAPVLGIAGSADRLLSPKITEDLMTKVPFAIYADVSAPHLAAQVAPDQVWAAISEEFESAA